MESSVGRIPDRDNKHILSWTNKDAIIIIFFYGKWPLKKASLLLSTNMSLSDCLWQLSVITAKKTRAWSRQLVASVLVFLVLAFLIITPTFPINPVDCCCKRGRRSLSTINPFFLLLCNWYTQLIALGELRPLTQIYPKVTCQRWNRKFTWSACGWTGNK